MDLSSFPKIFIVVGLVAILAETVIGVSTGFDLLLVGSILAIGGATGLVTGSVPVTLIISVILTFLYLAVFRSKLRQKLLKVTHHTNVDKLIGQTAIVIRTITPNTAGLVRVDDEDWRATAEFDSAASDAVLYEKTKVKVLSIEGVTLKVEKVVK